MFQARTDAVNIWMFFFFYVTWNINTVLYFKFCNSDVFPSQISKQNLQTVKDRFQAFLNGETQIVADEAFINAVQSYYEVRLFLFTSATSLDLQTSSSFNWFSQLAL